MRDTETETQEEHTANSGSDDDDEPKILNIYNPFFAMVSSCTSTGSMAYKRRTDSNDRDLHTVTRSTS